MQTDLKIKCANLKVILAVLMKWRYFHDKNIMQMCDMKGNILLNVVQKSIINRPNVNKEMI